MWCAVDTLKLHF